MEIEQILNQVEWLDNQRRQEKDTQAALRERIAQLEGNSAAVNQRMGELESEVTHLKTVLTRVDQYDAALSQHRIEFSSRVEEIENLRIEREREIEEVRRVQLEGITKHLTDLRKSLEIIPKLEGGLKGRIEEEYRLARLIDDLKQELLDVHRDDEEWIRSLRLLEEGQRRDDKRITDFQSEALALRRRVDHHRGRLDLTFDTTRKLESRVYEMATVESGRREAYNTFLEKQALLDVDREHKWREWQARFDTIENQTVEVESHLQSLQTAYRDVKRAKEDVETVKERVGRHIHEITEMQRLAEDRFRQEWTAFKADDQKRSVNYTLTQEEQSRETVRQQEKLSERLIEDQEKIQELQDIVHQLGEQTEKRLQHLLSVARDWVADYERLFGLTR